MNSSKLWFDGQRQALDELVEMADIYLNSAWEERGLTPLFSPLVVGSSGVGKSHLIRLLAEELDVPLLRLSPQEWIVIGSRESPRTLERIYDFVKENVRGIVAIDELEKFADSGSEWGKCSRLELFDVLDKTVNQKTKDMNWTEADKVSFRNNFMVVGTGTWQSIWERARAPELGFGSQGTSVGTEEIRRLIRKSNVIPPELLRRFNERIVVIPLPVESQYEKACQEYGLQAMAADLGIKLDVKEAASSALGARWLKEAFAQILLEARRQGRTDIVQTKGLDFLDASRDELLLNQDDAIDGPLS
jgi:SpoVK/Ycf46/Vps4 family AAA+-type ATPase